MDKKDIHNELKLKMKNYHTGHMHQWCHYSQTFGIRGDYWFLNKCWLNKVQIETWVKNKIPWNSLTNTRPKCGIELINTISLAKRSADSKEREKGYIYKDPVLKNDRTLYKHITEDLNIKCHSSITKEKMIKLLRTV